MLSTNTLKTIAGYFLTLVERYTKLPLASRRLVGICNFLKIDDTITTAGQPTAAQLELVKDAGYRAVINLAPQATANALPDERAAVEALGMTYIHIPVDFQRPGESDFERFCDAMREVGGSPVFVHCAANMRVSAFVYRYRWQIRGDDRQRAAQDLHRIWEPAGVWKAFVGD
jgi:uncharacterized protein (TIGR01244 family)